jgi:hypothetical protein
MKEVTEQPAETCQSIQKLADSSKRGIKKKTAEQLKDENFRRQILTFRAKGDTLRGKFGADVFVLVRRKGKLMVYTSRNSLDDPQWPLQPEEIARYYPLPMITTYKANFTLSTFQVESEGPKK